MGHNCLHIISVGVALHFLSGSQVSAAVVHDSRSDTPIILQCRGDTSRANKQATWLFNGKIVGAGCSKKLCVNTTLAQSYVYDLTIVNASRNDSGLYSCQFLYSDDESVTSNFDVIVADMPGHPVILPSLNVVEGSMSVVTCTSIGGYPTPNILWYKNGQLQLPANVASFSNDTHVVSNLSLSTSYMDNNGQLICNATNVLGSSAAASMLNVSYSARDITLKPLVALSIAEGKDQVLLCTANGNPFPDFNWSTDTNANITKSSNGSTSTLTIISVKRKAAGTYTCSATNWLNQISNVTNSASVIVDVLYAPDKPVMSSNVSIILAGDNIGLRCDVADRGNPQGFYSWTKGGMPLSGNVTASTMVITRIRLEDSGSYRCLVINDIGVSFSEALNLTVFAKPAIVASPKITTARVGMAVSLVCSAQGNPLPSFTWTRHNSSLGPGWNKSDNSSSSTPPFMARSLFSKQLITLDDFGSYSCMASNAHGNDTLLIELVPPSVPHPPLNVIVIPKWTAVVVTWEAGFDGGSPQQFTVYMNSKQVFKGSDTTYTVTGLDQGYNYTFSIVASNDVGSSNYSLSAMTTTLVVPSVGVLSFHSTLKLLIAVGTSEYCAEVNCTTDNYRTSNTTNYCSVTVVNLPPYCTTAMARMCVNGSDPPICGDYVLNYVKPKDDEAVSGGSPKLSEKDIIIIACVVSAFALLIIVVVTVVCCVRRKGIKKPRQATSASSLYHHDLSDAVRTSAMEVPYATYIRDQVYANPNFGVEYDDDSGTDAGALPNENIPGRHSYVYASVGVKTRVAAKAADSKNVPSYGMHSHAGSDIDEPDASNRDDSSTTSEPPPYHPQISVTDSNGTAATDSKQSKRVLYEVIV